MFAIATYVLVTSLTSALCSYITTTNQIAEGKSQMTNSENW